MKRLLKVLFMPADDGGCGHHRARIWNEAFNRLKLADSAILDPKEDEKEVRLAIDIADVIVTRLNTFFYTELIKETWPQKVVIFDHDDNTLEVLPSSPSYKDFGTVDVWVPMEKIEKTQFYKDATVGTKLKMKEEQAIPLWVTGITPGFNRFTNLKQHTNLIHSLMACNIATSPTRELSALWSNYADKVGVIPNCLDFRYYPDVEVKSKRKKDEIRIGWSGGSSHGADWKSVMPVIKKLIKKYPQITLVIGGSYFPENFTDIEDNIEYHPWTRWEAHPYRLKLLDLDMAIIPLADDVKFNLYKSELKMMEFSALRVPIIVRDQLPYTPYINRGENCLSYKTEEELEKCFEKLIKDVKGNKKLSKKMTDNAYEWVTTKRNVDLLAPDVIKVYKDLLPEKTQESIV